MEILFEIIKFIIYSLLIVIISKYILVVTLRKFAETLNLKPDTVGDIAGIATSIPELLTIGVSSYKGLINASIYNVLSSNIINLVQYILAIIMNKNQKTLKNYAIKLDICLVIITIIIPITLIIFNIEVNLSIIPLFIILYAFFKFLDKNAHKIYLQREDKKITEIIEKEQKWKKGKTTKTIKYSIYLILTGILLFVIGNLLGNTLEKLCNMFGVSEFIIGILLGFITSIPELITFFESQKHHKKSDNNLLGVVEATNNLLTSNILNLFIIQSIGVIIYTLII